MLLDKKEIEKILPQSDPLLLVDSASVIEGEAADSTVYINPEWDIFRGHFKNHPVLPGIYIAEYMAQTADLILMTIPGNKNMIPLFFGITQMRFLHPVYPGEILHSSAKIVCHAGNGMYDCEACVMRDGRKIAYGKITLALSPR